MLALNCFDARQRNNYTIMKDHAQDRKEVVVPVEEVWIFFMIFIICRFIFTPTEETKISDKLKTWNEGQLAKHN